ncbi:MAG: homoserine kinase [Verrucomicrobium sp.]|nr:homoserine kinase [Verrucomicrobium sp.]
MKTKAVSVRVPATSSNLGPGFDCLGVALKLHNTVRVAHAKEDAAEGMIAETARAFFQAAKIRSFPFAASVKGSVPPARGLGSSVTVRLGVAAGLNRLAGEPLPDSRLLALVVELEGHPDNAVPAFHGGFAACAGKRYLLAPVAPRLRFVGLVPDFELPTKKARAVLPKKVPLSDAVANVGRTALLTAAFAAQEYEALPGLFDDRLHQPYRAKLLPGWDAVREAALKAGALGFYLSGAGSTLMALTLKDSEKIAAAMLRAARKAGIGARTFVTQADNRGLV